MATAPRDPFELKLDDEQTSALALFLCRELQAGLDARAAQEADVDYWHQLYEQARTRTGRNQPWPDAADLTSYLGSEKVDALHARILKTIFVEPIWTVEGWGAAASNAPFVEEFHQWKAEEERLQGVIDKLVLLALIEPRGLLEVAEGTEMRTTRKRMQAKVQTDETTGGLILGDDGGPQLARDPSGALQEAQPQDIGATTVVDSTDRVRTGPVYRLLPYRDSCITPGHARDQADIWGYWKRFWRRYADIKRKAEGAHAMYDKDVVDKMTTAMDREPDDAMQRAKQSVAPADDGTTAEKELWEGTVLLDLNGFFESRKLPELRDPTFNGERWFLVTLHLNSMQMLRIQHDDLERSRFVPMILFPRPDRVTEGFSFIGHKLITTIEEHTAVRNLRADKAVMSVQAPIKRMQGALWDPVEQPWGPKAVIDVRDPREVEQMIVQDVTQPLVQWEQNCERTAERLAGVNDIASGQVAQESRTLGEIQMATEQSFVRMDLILRRAQEALEDIAQIRHAIWKRTLAEQPDGIDAPETLISSLEGRGVSINDFLPQKKITAQLLEGAFRFKPHGSVETADPNKLRQDWIAFMQAVPMMLQTFPSLVPMLQTPQAARAIFRQCLRVFRVENQQAFLGSPAQDLQHQLGDLGGGSPMLQQLMAGMPGMAGMPMGGPPQPGTIAPPPPPKDPPKISLAFKGPDLANPAVVQILQGEGIPISAPAPPQFAPPTPAPGAPPGLPPGLPPAPSGPPQP